MALYDDYIWFRGFWYNKDGTGPVYVDPLGSAVLIGSQPSPPAFSAITGAVADNSALAAALNAKADLSGGVVPAGQLPAGVGANRVAVRAVTLANVTIATALNSGDAVDGVTLANDDLVLVANQTDKAENGIYVAGASPARSASYDTFAEHAGLDVVVREGTTKSGSTWRFTSGATGVLDTDPLEVTQISLTGAALIDNNLSDLSNVATALTNLGLDNVDNVADADKPTSTAQQASIDTAVATRVKFGTAAPSGGADGDLYCRMAKPYYGALYERAAGVWAFADNSYTWETRPTAEAAAEGLVITISDLAGKPEFECVTYDAGTTWHWVPCSKRARFADFTPSNPGTASGTTDVVLDSLALPADLAFPGCEILLMGWYWFSTVTANTKRVLVKNSNGDQIIVNDCAADVVESVVRSSIIVESAGTQRSSRVGASHDDNDSFGNATTQGPSFAWDLTQAQTFQWAFDSVAGEATIVARCRYRYLEVRFP